jgi:hypothetical protein
MGLVPCGKEKLLDLIPVIEEDLLIIQKNYNAKS